MRKIPFGDISERTCFCLTFAYGIGAIVIGIMLCTVIFTCGLRGGWVWMSLLWTVVTFVIVFDLFLWLFSHGRSMLRNQAGDGVPNFAYLLQQLMHSRCCSGPGPPYTEDVTPDVTPGPPDVTPEVTTELNLHKYILILAVILPLNSFFLFTSIGAPVFEPSVLEGVAGIDGLLEAVKNSDGDLVIPAGDLQWNVETQEVINLSSNAVIANISWQTCYRPSSPEFELLGSLQGEDRPKQGFCESLLGSSLAEHWAIVSDSDGRWEEIYDFSCRLFVLLGGLVGESLIEGSGGGLLCDLTDAFDMVMLSFQNVVQLNDGLNLLEGFLQVVDLVLFLNYCSLIVRCLHSLDIGRSVVRRFFQCTCLKRTPVLPDPYNDQDEKRVFGAGVSLIFEILFLLLRFIAFCAFSVPMSVLAMKNIFGIIDDWQQLFPRKSSHGAAGDEESALPRVPGAGIRIATNAWCQCCPDKRMSRASNFTSSWQPIPEVLGQVRW